MNEKLRIQREVAARVASLLEIPELKFIDEHPDAGGPDAIITFDGVDKVVELTRADPEGSGALTLPRGQRGYLSGSVRGPLHKLWDSFHELSSDVRCFDASLFFQDDRIPQGKNRQDFLAQLCEVMRLVKEGAYQCPNHYWRRGECVLRPPYGGRTLLTDYCSRIELDPEVSPYGGHLSTNHDSYWGAHADIEGIVASKAGRVPQAHWLVIFEWEIWGSVPDFVDLPSLRGKSGFERVFLLRPIEPSQLIEWDDTMGAWAIVASCFSASATASP